MNIALGTQVKEEYDLYFGDHYVGDTSTGGFKLGGFKTKDYINLSNKNKIIFYGSFYTGPETEKGKSDFRVCLIDKDGNIVTAFQASNISGNTYRVDITQYDGDYQIAFFCFNIALGHLYTYAKITSIKFVEF